MFYLPAGRTCPQGWEGPGHHVHQSLGCLDWNGQRNCDKQIHIYNFGRICVHGWETPLQCEFRNIVLSCLRTKNCGSHPRPFSLHRHCPSLHNCSAEHKLNYSTTSQRKRSCSLVSQVFRRRTTSMECLRWVFPYNIISCVAYTLCVIGLLSMITLKGISAKPLLRSNPSTALESSSCWLLKY